VRGLSRWPDFRLRTKGLIVVAFPIFATIAIVCASYVMGIRAAAAEKWVNHTLEAGELIQRLRSSKVESTAHARGYFITGDEKFAVLAREAAASFDRRRKRLVALTIDNPVQRQTLAQILTQEGSREDRVNQAIINFQLGTLRWEQLGVNMKANEAERLKMEKLMTAMEVEEKRLLIIRMARVETLHAQLRAITAICVVLGSAGAVVMFFLFASGITNRIGKLQTNVALLVTGGVLEEFPEGRDEIGVLSEGVARAAEILRRRTTALENALHGIAELDAAGRYISFNRAYGQMTGLGEVISAPSLAATVYPEDRHFVEDAAVEMLENGRTEIEARVAHPDGRVAYLGITFVPVSEKREEGYFVFVLDVSLRKEAKLALIHARDAAEAANRAKSDFLARMSHEIRTPMNLIMGMNSLLRESSLTEKQRQHAEISYRNMRRLLRLINGILDLSKVEAGMLTLEAIPFDLNEVINECSAAMSGAIEAKGLEFEVSIDPDVWLYWVGDAERVHQVLVNLIGNSAKFTARGKIGLRVSTENFGQGERGLRFEVTDTGCGVPADKKDLIFEAFQQAEGAMDRPYEGTGLGLSIAKTLVEMMAGRIWLEEANGKGSKFVFTAFFPIARKEEVRDRLGVTNPAETCELEPGTRILLAEDNPENVILMRAYLDNLSLSLHFASNGAEAVKKRQRSSYDVILMDIQMPIMDGYTATREIRAWEKAHNVPAVPILALTAHALSGASSESLEAGCDGHLTKPVERNDLMAAIVRFTKRTAKPVQAPVSDLIAARQPAFLQNRMLDLAKLREALAAKDFAAIQHIGHNSKGTGAGYGFPDIGLAGANVECAARAFDLVEIEKAIGEFEGSIQAASPAVISAGT
jgi:PAS domain S-box-containing protein